MRVCEFRARIVVVLLFGTVLSGCGYALAGRGSFLPAHIKTIGVPLFANNTPVFEVEEPLTEKVRSEFIGRGKYQVVPDTTGTDAVLSGEIVNISVSPAGFNNERQASRYSIIVTANLEFRDVKNDKVLWADRSLQFTEEYEVAVAGETLDGAAFFGQETNAVERLATNFAKTVVNAVLETF